MLLTDAVSEYLGECRAKNLSDQTLRWYDQKLGVWLAQCPADAEAEDVTPSQVRKFVAGLTGISAHTRKGYTQCVKGFLVWCEEEGLLAHGTGKRVKLPKVEQVVIKTLSPAHLRLLHAAADGQHYKGLVGRDHAILAVLLGTGLRAAELCSLTVGRTFVKGEDCYLLLKGKGRKEREVGVPPQAAARLRRYLYRYRPQSRAEEVFLSRDGKPLTPRGLDQILYRLEDRAGEERFVGIRVSAHTFRHTFAVTYLSEGGDIYKLSKLMGHTTVSTTERYLRDYMQRNARAGGPDVLRTFS